MTQNIIVESLREKASMDPVANAVLHMWALRRRARNQVTVNGLHVRMKEEGFQHKKEDYEPLLRLMARLGLGKLQQDSKGRVVALKHVETTLQSLGRAVCDPKSPGVLGRMKRKNKFRRIRPLPSPGGGPPKPSENAAFHSSKLSTATPKASITVTFADKSMTFPLPADATEEQAAAMTEKSLKFLASL